MVIPTTTEWHEWNSPVKMDGLTVSPKPRYDYYLDGKHSFFPEACAHHRGANGSQPHSQITVAPPDSFSPPAAGSQGRESGYGDRADDVLPDRSLRQVGHHQEEHGSAV